MTDDKKWKISTSVFETVYMFTTEEQLNEIKDQGFIRIAITREEPLEKPPESLEKLKEKLQEVIAGKKELPSVTTFISQLRSFILESVHPIEFEGMEGYLLTIDATGLTFFTEGYSSLIDEKNKIIMIGDVAWVPVEDISADRIVKIEYIKKL